MQLKFLSHRGEFLGAEAGARVRADYESSAEPWVAFDKLGGERAEPGALAWHLERVLAMPAIDVAAIRARRLRVVVDGCSSVGGVAVPALLAQLSAETIELDCVPDGAFRRELEPLPEHLGRLGDAVRESRADFGVAVDPDADRAAFVDAAGVPLGEEYTVALGTREILAHVKGAVVTNLSTSRMLDAVCADAGVPLHRTPVGEAHVVEALRAREAVAGGEGNGGMIVPSVHYGRDGLVAVALIAHAVTRRATTLRALADTLPRLHMVKSKMARPDAPWTRAESRLREAFAGWDVDTADGLRFDRDGGWVHVRASGTEPVVRVIAETASASDTEALVERARAAVSGP